jgi:multisubunit Na+/H+ antiporter MnhC subunit
VNALEQNLLYLTTIVILLGTLTVFVVQYLRSRRRDRNDGKDD